MTPSFHINSWAALKLYVIVCWVLTPYLLAGDGPQNTGRLRLKQLSQQQIEATLQVDKKVLLNPKELFNEIQIKNRNQICQPSTPDMISGEDTVSAACIFECADPIGQIQLNLVGIKRLPPAFSLGVQTPFEHFSLTHEIPERTTQLSVRTAFFFSGFFMGLVRTLPLGRPYAFSFGGLEILPWGVWWFLLLGTLGLSGLGRKTKLFSLGLSFPVVAGVAYFLLAREASLLFVTAPRLELGFLILIFSLAAIGFWHEFFWSKPVSIFLSLVLMIAGGFELAIILRWIEGNPQIPLNEALLSFFMGLFSISGIFITLSILMVHHFKAQKAVTRIGRMFVLSFTFYTAMVLVLQL